jgi:hypothetical protein
MIQHENSMSIENREEGDHAVTTINGKIVYMEDLIMNPAPDETVIHLKRRYFRQLAGEFEDRKKDAIELKLVGRGCYGVPPYSEPGPAFGRYHSSASQKIS